MAIRIHLHGHLRALAGRDLFQLEPRSGETFAQLLGRWQNENAGCAGLIVNEQQRLQGGVVIALDGQVVSFDTLSTRALMGGESIDIIPELTGGQGAR